MHSGTCSLGFSQKVRQPKKASEMGISNQSHLLAIFIYRELGHHIHCTAVCPPRGTSVMGQVILSYKPHAGHTFLCLEQLEPAGRVWKCHVSRQF
ncbi:hypothetical protein FKM82_006764 [Ascaphus truei]